jgi:hypothetical protein
MCRQAGRQPHRRREDPRSRHRSVAGFFEAKAWHHALSSGAERPLLLGSAHGVKVASAARPLPVHQITALAHTGQRGSLPPRTNLGSTPQLLQRETALASQN